MASKSASAIAGARERIRCLRSTGGVKEKVLAARRAGLRRVVLPRGNQEDLRDLPEEVRREVELVAVLPGLILAPAKAA